MIVAHAIDDKIVEHAALRIEQKAVAAFAGFEAVEIVGDGQRQQSGRALPAHDELPHVTDVEHRGDGAGVVVFDQNSLVLDGHVPSGEGGHFRAVGAVPGGQGCFEQFGHGQLLTRKSERTGVVIRQNATGVNRRRPEGTARGRIAGTIDRRGRAGFHIRKRMPHLECFAFEIF